MSSPQAIVSRFLATPDNDQTVDEDERHDDDNEDDETWNLLYDENDENEDHRTNFEALWDSLDG